ncbi:MAG: hypothetical protein NXI18_19495 [Alphaproteobacteria bacterium]|nr:hypothetical protein [Alphaproteobacteria bacterium]
MAVAAIESGRRWVGREVVPEIFEIACNRIKAAEADQHRAFNER